MGIGCVYPGIGAPRGGGDHEVRQRNLVSFRGQVATEVRGRAPIRPVVEVAIGDQQRTALQRQGRTVCDRGRAAARRRVLWTEHDRHTSDRKSAAGPDRAKRTDVAAGACGHARSDTAPQYAARSHNRCRARADDAAVDGAFNHEQALGRGAQAIAS